MNNEEHQIYIAEWQRIVQEGNDAYANRRYTEAELAFVAALRIIEKANLPESMADLSDEEKFAHRARLAKSLNNTAALYQTQGKYQMADELYKRCLELKKEMYGEEHLEVAISLHNMAVMHSAKRKFGLAEPLYKTSLEMRERLQGKENPELSTILRNYALCLRRMDRGDEAKVLEERAENMEEKKPEAVAQSE
ncbi:MAG TPA: tetratricopeptide repeat protein [Drouetiella sp.]